MKKFLPYIFTLVIIANIFAPFQVFLSSDKKIEARTAVVEAGGGGTIKVTHTDKENSIAVGVTVIWASIEDEQVIKIRLQDRETQDGEDFIGTSKGGYNSDFLVKKEPGVNINTAEKYIGFINGNQIRQGKKYDIYVTAWQKDASGDMIIQGKDSTGRDIDYIETNPKAIAVDILNTQEQNEKDRRVNLPNCSLLGIGDGTFFGCFLQLFYYVFFEPTSWLFAQTGRFFDFMFAYSIADSSYRTAFVVEGWGILRDICNVLFIFILLYVALSTVLNLHGFKTKEMIINVIIIGLLINFSLFATQVIIDTSNILARVFYNSEALKPKAAVLEAGTSQSNFKEISLSQGIVAKVNPQNIIYESAKVNSSTQITGGDKKDIGNGSWFIVILMATIVNIIGLIVFWLLGWLLLSRVVSLWVAMVVVPATFFSYTVPAMQSMAFVGWKKWWPETIGVAFMAPILMFFIYLILLFLDTGFLDIANPGRGNDILQIIVPFLFIIMLLLKAKDIAKKLGGEIGSFAMKGGEIIGGAALGLAAGGAAMGLQRTVGKASSRLANSAGVKNWASQSFTTGGFTGAVKGFLGKGALKTTKFGAKSSFDLRRGAVGAGLAIASHLSGMNLKSAEQYFKGVQAGGYEADRKRKVAKKQEFASWLAVGEDEDLTQAMHQTDIDHQTLLQNHHNESRIHELENMIKVLRDKSTLAAQNAKLTSSSIVDDDGNRTLGAATNPATGNTFNEDATIAKNNLTDAMEERSAIKNGSMYYTSTGELIDKRTNTVNGNLSKEAIDGIERAAKAAAYAAERAASAAADVAALADDDPIKVAAKAKAEKTANAAAISKAAIDTAKATKAVSDGDPRAEDLRIIAVQSNQEVADRAAANPTNEKLVAASQKAADALRKIAEGVSGRSINDLEDHDIPHAHHKVTDETKRRQRVYATGLAKSWIPFGVLNYIAPGMGNNERDEAVYKILMGAKMDSGHGGGGGLSGSRMGASFDLGGGHDGGGGHDDGGHDGGHDGAHGGHS